MSISIFILFLIDSNYVVLILVHVSLHRRKFDQSCRPDLIQTDKHLIQTGKQTKTKRYQGYFK
jgi:hypothetical protein